MKLTNVKRIVAEDFAEEDRDLVNKLGGLVNEVFEQLAQGLNKNISIRDNMNEDIINVDVYVNANGTPLVPTQFKYILRGNCVGISVINAVNLDNPANYPVSAPFVSFNQTSGSLITITNIKGLQPTTSYRLTLRVTAS
jgi:hypothetical protein